MIPLQLRLLLLAALTLSLGACELVGNIVQFGFWTGVVVVLLIVAVVMWLGRRFRG